MSKIGGPSLSLVENNVSASSAAVGHYKGVMLCNRPFGGTVVTQKSSQSDAKAVFGTGVVPQPIGVNVAISAKEKLMKRPKKDSVLVKHKKWLADLQKTKERLEEQYVDDLRRKEEEKLKFQEQEKRMRESSRLILADSKFTLSAADAKAGPQTESKDDKPQSKSVASSKTAARPAWSVSQEDADRAAEAKREAEEDALLDFAKSLDYDRFISDMEVQVMVEKLRERIAELEHDVESEAERDADAETRAARREMLALMSHAESRLAHADEFNREKRADSEALQAAKALLGEEEDMQAVHSTRSVVQLLKNAKDKIQVVHRAVNISEPAEPKVLNEPKVVMHEPNEGARMEEKKSVSKLPYMNRNPAV